MVTAHEENIAQINAAHGAGRRTRQIEYTRRAAKALSMAEQYYRTAYHCAADIYGTDDASEMLLDDIGNNSKFIDRMIEEDD